MLFARFWKDRRGGVAPLLALAAVPLAGFVGAAVDYSRANSARTSMQVSLDSTALMLSKVVQNMPGEQISTTAQNYFKAVFKHPEVQNLQLTTTLTNPQLGSFQLVATSTGTLNTVFASLIGKSQIDIKATSQVVWGIKKLNLALVLDNTGSMAQSGKMTALKTAAHNLLTTLQNAAQNPGDVLVSIVPFSTDVNVGGVVDTSYIRWTEWDIANGSCSNSSYTTQSSCVSHSKTWTPKAHSTWNGCVMDRDQNNDVLATAPSAGASATQFPAHQATACPASMMSLTSDWTSLNSKIDAMTPTGNTNVTIGLALGWQTLSTNVPFTAPTPAPDLDRVIVLLTDGENTQNRWTSTASSIDTRTQKVCDNVKADNIKVYTVRVMDGDVTLLKGCATKPEMYYDVTQASQLNSVFSSIAQNLANLRIAK